MVRAWAPAPAMGSLAPLTCARVDIARTPTSVPPPNVAAFRLDSAGIRARGACAEKPLRPQFDDGLAPGGRASACQSPLLGSQGSGQPAPFPKSGKDRIYSHQARL